MKIDFIGDVNAGAPIEIAFPFSEVIVFGHECVATASRELRPHKIAVVQASPYYGFLKADRVLAACANNHILDFGSQGVVDTVASVESSGFSYAGVGINSEAPRVSCRVGDVCVLNMCERRLSDLQQVGASAVAVLEDYDIAKLVQAARNEGARRVVLFLHWGHEHSYWPNKQMMRIARNAIDCGADAVFGCHAHVYQGAELYKGCPIVYGLGNFFFEDVFASKESGGHRITPHGPQLRAAIARYDSAINQVECFRTHRRGRTILLGKRLKLRSPDFYDGCQRFYRAAFFWAKSRIILHRAITNRRVPGLRNMGRKLAKLAKPG